MDEPSAEWQKTNSYWHSYQFERFMFDIWLYHITFNDDKIGVPVHVCVKWRWATEYKCLRISYTHGRLNIIPNTHVYSLYNHVYRECKAHCPQQRKANQTATTPLQKHMFTMCIELILHKLFALNKYYTAPYIYICQHEAFRCYAYQSDFCLLVYLFVCANRFISDSMMF